MKRVFPAAAILSILLMPAMGSAALEATGIKVYATDNGPEVALVQLKEPGKYLIQVTGSMSSLDNLVLAYELDNSSSIPGLIRYRTMWRGTDYFFVHYQTPRGGGPGSMILYSTNRIGDGQHLVFSEARTRAAKPADLVTRHQQQLKDGSIARFQRFDRLAEQAKPEQQLAEAAKPAFKACGFKMPIQIAWSTISDERLRSYSISGMCEAPLSAMEQLCDSAEARKFLQAQAKQMLCQFGQEMKMEITPQGVLTWTTAERAVNAMEFAKKYLEQMAVPSDGPVAAVAAGAEVPPWGQVKTLGERIALEKTAVCSDGKSSYVALAPDSHRIYKLYFGNDKTFWRVPSPGLMRGNMFFDPRVSTPSANPNFRGTDMRLLSEVELDIEKKTCAVRCGSHSTALQILDGKAASQLLRRVPFAAPLHKRSPHVLTRDEKGNYYYVDRGNTPETEKNFRLFVGPKGNLKLKAMTNIVADSNGEIFSTKSGSLRFITGPGGQDSSWIQGKKVTKLIAVPVDQNFGLIYNELGPYTGERLGTPCDVW